MTPKFRKQSTTEKTWRSHNRGIILYFHGIHPIGNPINFLLFQNEDLLIKHQCTFMVSASLHLWDVWVVVPYKFLSIPLKLQTTGNHYLVNSSWIWIYLPYTSEMYLKLSFSQCVSDSMDRNKPLRWGDFMLQAQNYLILVWKRM